MPFFSGRRQPSPPPREPSPPPPPPVEEPRRKGLFGRKEREPEYTQQPPMQQQQQQQYPVEPPAEADHGRRHGLFSSRRDRSPEYTSQPPMQQQQNYPVEHPADHETGRKHGHGLFGRRHRSPSPTSRGALDDRRSMTSHSSASSGSFHTTPDHRSTNGGSVKRGFLSKRGRGNQRQDEEDLDPSIIHARDRLMGAEAAEQDAARALVAARESAASAREDILRLEAEAREDARRAKIKETQAREFSKRGKALGRFG